MEALETNKRREAVESSESKEEDDEYFEDVEEDLDPKDQIMAKLIKVVKGEKYKVKIDVNNFGGNLNEEELLDWIACLDNYFECEEIPKE